VGRTVFCVAALSEEDHLDLFTTEDDSTDILVLVIGGSLFILDTTLHSAQKPSTIPNIVVLVIPSEGKEVLRKLKQEWCRWAKYQ